ncbi:FGGY-family carbohydrate kinase [Christensenella timonensis]|uniref:FGGY-family carbohydrate kinase n=1 Tax=Christensenella timonensis TaxID=1816678 RepID=UPI00082C1D27|nr:FGGY-family carbohydrate kinase [Christensenella timonensis]
MGREEYVLGIDMGTSSVKAGLFTLTGTPIAFADATYPLYTPRSGWAEQKTDEWWNAICKATRKLVDKSGVSPSAIMGMSVDTTCCTMLFLDRDRQPLRPAVMWMDVRASKQAKEITATGDPMLKYNGYGNVSAECMPAKVLWIKQNEPEVWEKTGYICECLDWLTHKLAGELTASIDTMAPRWYYDRPNGGWPLDFFASFGLDDVVEKLPQDILDMGAYVGKLTEKAAADLGLAAGIPVGEGGADAFVGMVGLNVVQPGRIAMITGTSHLHLGLTEKEMHSKGMWGSYPDAVIRGLHLIEGGQTSTGAIVNWFKTNFCGDIRQLAEKEGRSVYDLLNEGAQELPIGADGLLALDYFQGNRTPYADPDVRGMFYGLSLSHTPYHVYRAIIESICYGTEAIMQTFRDGGMEPDGIYISGGAVKSAFWTQAHADVCNLPIFIPKVTEAPCLGSAILGAVACGAYADIQTAAKNMVTIEDRVEPDREKQQEYRFYYEKYKEAYLDSRGWMHGITARPQ